MAINKDTIISSYDERLTLLQWLKKLEGAIADFDLEKYYTKDEVLALLANKVSNAEFNEFKATTRDGYRNLSDALDGLANTKADVSALNNVIGNVDELDGKVGNLEVEISEKADVTAVDAKLDKVTGATAEARVYVKNANGTQGTIDLVNSATPYTIPQRGANGGIAVQLTPQNDNEAVSKAYADTKQSQLYLHRITYREDNFSCRILYILQSSTPIASLSGIINSYRLARIVSLSGQNAGAVIYDHYFNVSSEEIVTLASGGIIHSLSNSLVVIDTVTAL